MENLNQPIVVNLPDGQNTLTLLQGEAPKQLDVMEPEKINLHGTILAPFNWLEKRAGLINQHKAYILVNRDKLSILLVFNEDDAYNQGKVLGTVEFSDIYKRLHINDFSYGWTPENLGQFLKLNRSLFVDRKENMDVVNALKTFNGKATQEVSRLTNEKGDRAMKFKQMVNSNIPPSFKLKIPVFSGGSYEEINVETYASVDGTDVSIVLQSPGANDVVEKAKLNVIDDVLAEIREIASDIAIIEQ